MALAEEFDTFLIDLDGVVYVGDALVAGADGAIATLRKLGKDVLFLTNDPRQSSWEYAEKLRRIGVPASEEDVLTAGAATAAYVAEQEQSSRSSVLVVGSHSLKKEIEETGLQLASPDDASEVSSVIVGGHEDFDYQELRIAARAVLRGARLYATNRDPSFPMPDGPWPATGSILAAIETASQSVATVVGKPERHMFEMALKRLGEARRVAVVGDSLWSDVQGGKRAGFGTIWVDERKADPSPDMAPDHRIPSLASLMMDSGDR